LDLKTGDLIVIDVLGTAKSIAKMRDHWMLRQSNDYCSL